MRHIWSRKAKIQAQMAISGNADIFLIKVDSRLKTILFPTGVATEVNFNSVFSQKFRHHNTTFSCKPQHCFWAFFSQPAGHGPICTEENHAVISLLPLPDI